MNEDMDGPRKMARDTMAMGQRIEKRRLSGLARLESFPLWKRLILYPRFNKIRKILANRAMLRSHFVLMSIGMIKTIKRIERKRKNK
jgi:hypothetical protein